MNKFHDHYNVTDLIAVNRVTKDEMLGLAAEGRVPIAVWADNVYVCPIHYSQQAKTYQRMAKHFNLSNGGWIYVRPNYLSKYKSGNENVRMNLFRSGPQADTDIAATQSSMDGIGRNGLLRRNSGLRIAMDDLWVPADSWDLIEEEFRNESENASAFGIARRVYTDILAAHDKNPALPHPNNCSYTGVYLHLARQAAPPEKNADYWINDSNRDPNEVGRKSGLGTLAIQYRPEDDKEPTQEISFKEFMNTFDQIKHQ